MDERRFGRVGKCVMYRRKTVRMCIRCNNIQQVNDNIRNPPVIDLCKEEYRRFFVFTRPSYYYYYYLYFYNIHKTTFFSPKFTRMSPAQYVIRGLLLAIVRFYARVHAMQRDDNIVVLSH